MSFSHFVFGFLMLFSVAMLASLSPTAQAESWDPGAKDYSGHKGVTLYVSKLGDNSDGSSWAKAFHTVQQALSAVPDDLGGHRVIIRPDTYMEDNIFTGHKGAEGAYNLLVGDTDGQYGSGASGYVVLDSGDPSKGFKSYDWWGTLKSYKKGWSSEHNAETFSANCWDRWIFRNLYATGGDGGFMFDLVDKVEPFTVIVEDCTSIGRAFGGGVGNCLSRKEEPIVFRRCNLWALDWWGDTAAAYVRIEHETMPDYTDIIFEDCTMTSPQCALKGGNYGFHTFMRIKVKGCRLVTLNFSQPAGTPTDGIVQSVEEGQYVHVDFEDSLLMGYKLFGVKVKKETEKDIGFTSKRCQAYVQFTQDVPKGFHRLDRWPTEIFSTIAPPVPPDNRPKMTKTTPVFKDMCEVSPVIWKDRLCLMTCIRPASGGTSKDYWLELRDAETNEELGRFAEGYSLACAFVNDGVFYAFASRFENDNWNDVTMFKSPDLKTWESKKIIEQESNEHLFNSSVCKGPDGFVLVYETNDPTYPAFTAKFAVSKDLDTWTKLPDAFGKDRYAACPCIRFANGYYYVLYTEHRTPCWRFEVYIARSKDLKTWELSPANPVLKPEVVDDCIDASDPDLAELNGVTHLYYSVGDQHVWMNIKHAVYEGPMAEFLAKWFEPEPAPENRLISK